jgi:hypothetical protein
MKKLILIIPLLFAFGFVNAQYKKVKEKDVIGTWRLVIDVDMEKIEDEIDDEDNAFARIVIRSVSGLVDGILDNLDIYFEFKEGGRLKVMVDAFGVDDVEYTEWSINRRGELIIEDTDSFQSDDEYWMFDGDLLVAYGDGGEIDNDAKVYLVNVDSKSNRH